MNEKGRGMRSRMKVCVVMAVAVFAAAAVTGCETVRGVAGISTKILEDTRPEAQKRVFACDIEACYKKAEASLKKAKSYIYARDRKAHMIAAYMSETDTTPVGVFMTEQESGTLVEVSSPSGFAREITAELLFADLEK
jgi:hypothetical protein